MISTLKTLIKRWIPDTHPVRLAWHRSRGWWAAYRAGFPAKKLKIIGITGTDGKTTTVAMTAHILRSVGKKVGAVSTTFFQILDKAESNPTHKTSLDAAVFQKFLSRYLRLDRLGQD